MQSILTKLMADSDNEIGRYGAKHALAGQRYLGLEFGAVDLTDEEADLLEAIRDGR